MKKDKHKRKKTRGERNLFWLVKSTEYNILLLFNRKPYKRRVSWWKRLFYDYKEDFVWESVHGCSYLHVDQFPSISRLCPIPVHLIIIKDDMEADMFIQRIKDNLFIDNSKTSLKRHYFRISNKLFPEITEKSGVVKVKLVAIY